MIRSASQRIESTPRVSPLALLALLLVVGGLLATARASAQATPDPGWVFLR